MKGKNKRFFFLILLGLSLLLRILWILQQDNTVNIWTDWWDELGWNVASGKGYVVENPFLSSGVPYYSWRPPLFPLFLAFIYRLFGHSYLAAKIGLAVVGTLALFYVYVIARELFSEEEGWFSSLLCGVYPTFIFFTGYLTPETLTMFCLLAFCASLLIAQSRIDCWHWALAGFWLGACILCRTIMVLFFIFVLAWMFILQIERKRPGMCFFIFSLSMCLTILPWVWRNWRMHKVFLLHSTDSGQALYINNNPYSFTVEPSGTAFVYDSEEVGRLSELDATRLLSSRAISFIKNNPGLFALYVSRRFLNFWRPLPYTVSGPGKAYTRRHQIFSLLYTGPVFALAILGILMGISNWRKLSLLYFLIGYYSGSYILVRAIIRYRMPLEPFLIILAVHGFFSLWQKKRKHEKMFFLPG